LVLLALLLLGVWIAYQRGLDPSAAAFLAGASLTGVLFLLALYDLVITALHMRYPPRHRREPLVVTGLVEQYARWLSPVGFLLGILVGHYFWH
jgi:hypothetical protein